MTDLLDTGLAKFWQSMHSIWLPVTQKELLLMIHKKKLS